MALWIGGNAFAAANKSPPKPKSKSSGETFGPASESRTKKDDPKRGDKEKDDKDSAHHQTKSAKPESKPASSNKRFGIGLEFGSNATYGNALVPHAELIEYLDVQGGIGYNTTGLKMGIGASFIVPVSRFGIDAGGAFVHSNGTKDKVALSGKFKPDGTESEENVTISKRFTLTPANYLSGFAGAFFDLAPAFRVLGHVNFNKLLSGNEIKFDGDTEYDQAIDANNETEVQADFDPKAKQKLDISGIGFSLGVQFRF